MVVEVEMMRVLIVVESSFGNTRAVADAMAEGMRQFATVEVCPVAEVSTGSPPLVDLLVVGGPTHAFGMSRPGTRKDAAQQAGHGDAPGIGVREWLEGLSPGVGWAAAFDTRIGKGWITGSAARAIARRLRGLGGELVVKPESFLVTGTSGPLVDGERDRARRWGEQLVTKFAAIDVRPRR